MTSPTEKTLKALRDRGLKVGIVERWIPGARIRKDLFGIIDIIATAPGAGIIGVQSTGTGFSEHVKKLMENRQACIDWLSSTPDAHLELYGWRKLKVKRGGKAMKYEARIKEFTLEDFIEDPLKL